jgi:hypothetical protein
MSRVPHSTGLESARGTPPFALNQITENNTGIYRLKQNNENENSRQAATVWTRPETPQDKAQPLHHNPVQSTSHSSAKRQHF